MNVFLDAGKRIKKWIFIEEFDEIYENPTTKAISVLYCCCGGFCFHNDVRPEFRKVWIVFNILNFFFVYASCIFYLFNAPTKDYFASLLPAPTMSGLLAKIFLYAWIFYGKNMLTKLVDFLDKTDEEEACSTSFCATHLRKPRPKIMIGVFCCVLLCTAANNLETYVSHENYYIILYPIYFPYRKTIASSIAIRIIQSVTVVPELIAFVVLPTLVITVAASIYTRFELLGLFLRKTSYSVFLQIDEVVNLEVAMDEKRIRSNLSKIRRVKIKRALVLDELTRKITTVIEQHQELYSIAKLCAEHMKYMYTVGHMEVFLASVTEIFFISLITQTTIFRRESLLVGLFFEILLIWLLICYVGEMFQEMNEIIASEIYECPWYLLKPKDRRLVHTFLTLTQRPITIDVYGLYPANLLSFPDTLNTIYSNVQRLRTLQLNKQKN